jgi:hypothetical protein
VLDRDGSTGSRKRRTAVGLKIVFLNHFSDLITGGNLCNFNKRWNPHKLGKTLLLLLLGIGIDNVHIYLDVYVYNF